MKFACASKLDRKSGVRLGERGTPVDCLRRCYFQTSPFDRLRAGSSGLYPTFRLPRMRRPELTADLDPHWDGAFPALETILPGERQVRNALQEMLIFFLEKKSTLRSAFR
jgi:hypothetical protein